MVSDKRQQELFKLWATLSSPQLGAWIEMQSDKEALYDLILQLESKIQKRKFMGATHRRRGSLVA